LHDYTIGPSASAREIHSSKRVLHMPVSTSYLSCFGYCCLAIILLCIYLLFFCFEFMAPCIFLVRSSCGDFWSNLCVDPSFFFGVWFRLRQCIYCCVGVHIGLSFLCLLNFCIRFVLFFKMIRSLVWPISYTL
jgi:hypothetical protein